RSSGETTQRATLNNGQAPAAAGQNAAAATVGKALRAVERIEALRHQRWTGAAIAAELAVSPATVSRILKRLGLNKLRALEPAQRARRCERDKPAEARRPRRPLKKEKKKGAAAGAGPTPLPPMRTFSLQLRPAFKSSVTGACRIVRPSSPREKRGTR